MTTTSAGYFKTATKFSSRDSIALVNIHALQTGTVAVKRTHRKLIGPPFTRLFSILLDWRYTEPLPIYAWAIEHPEGIIVVDTGEAAAVMEPDYFETDFVCRRCGL